MIVIGIDNGSSGSIGILGLPSGPKFLPVPTKEEQDYTKSKKRISRLDHEVARKLLVDTIAEALSAKDNDIRVVMERPMVNPTRFVASCVALRVLESWEILLEQLALGYEFVDSKAWQGVLLPNVVGSTELKRASKEAGIRLFPKFTDQIKKQKDADGILIAEWVVRTRT